MKMTTPSVPTRLAITPLWIESLPRSGPTVRSSITFSFTGNLPDARLTARSFALWTVKLPVICACRPGSAR